MAKRRPSDPLDELEYIRQVCAPSKRDQIIARVGRGEITPQEADAEASTIGVGPLSTKPDPASFDPMQEAYWDIAMVLAWFMYESSDAVREMWNAYRQGVWYWLFEDRYGWALKQPGPVELLDLVHLSLDLECHSDFKSAKERLWNCAKTRKIVATGRCPQNAPRREISPPEWYDLELRMVGPRLALCAGDLTYTDVLFPRIDCVKAQGESKGDGGNGGASSAVNGADISSERDEAIGHDTKARKPSTAREEAALQAFDALFGVDPVHLLVEERDRQLSDYNKRRGGHPIASRTIRRALAARGITRRR